MDLTNDDVLQILKIIDESDYDDVRLEIGDLKLHVRKQGAADDDMTAPQAESREMMHVSRQPPVRSAEAPPVVSATPKTVAADVVAEGQIAVRAPMLGTFFRAPAPGERPFVEVGDQVGPDDTVCLVEVMKLFNSIKAGVAGKVVKILVENATLVEYGQLLILIEQGPTGAPGKNP